MKINIIGVPLHYGCDRLGVEKAPNHLRKLGLLNRIRKHGHKTYDIGNLYVPDVPESDKFKKGYNLKYLDAIVEVNNNLAEIVYDSLQGDAFPIIIGGDHALGLGSASGVGMSFDDFGIIWLDAHGDINTTETSPSGNIHGMALGALMGKGDKELVDTYSPGNKVNPENVFLVGTRSLDEGEKRFVEEENISVYSMALIEEQGIKFVADDIIKKLRERRIRNIHFSIDVDSLDPSVAPGTGTRVDDGLSLEQFKLFVESMLATHLVKSLDLVEYNPDLDIENQTGEVVLDILDFISEKL